MAELLPSTLSCGSFDAIQLPIGKHLKTLERTQRRIEISSRIREVPYNPQIQAGFRSLG